MAAEHNHPKVVTMTEAAKYSYGSYDVAIDDESVRYVRDHGLEAFVESLARDPEDLGEGVEWYDLDDGIDVDSKITKGLLTRKDTRGIVEAVLNRTDKYAKHSWPTMSFIIGSPGIGKTRTFIYMLRQLLQEENVNVQYFSQKECKASVFLRRQGKTYAFKSKDSVPPKAKGSLFGSNLETDRIRTYIFLDPDENGAEFAHPQMAHLIVACSANSKHFHNIEKESNASLFYLGLPSTKEVEAMTMKLKPELDRKVLLNRINDVGPVPRYLFHDDRTFEKRKKEIQRRAIENNVIDESLVLTALTNGTAVTESPSLCGALFAHVNLQTTNTDGVESMNYEEQRISVLSQYAAWLLYKRFRSAFVQATIIGEHCDTTAVFEKICAFDLIVGGNFKVVSMKATSAVRSVKNFKPAASVIRVMPSRNETETRNVFVRPALSGESSIATDYEASEPYEPPTKRQRLGPPFNVLSDGFSAIDFLNTERQVFQATMGADHDMKGWVDLLFDAGILLLDNEGKLNISAKTKPLEFYWIVPHDRTGWATRKRKIPTKADIPKKYLKEKHVIDKAIEKHVRQFVIFVEKEQPRQSEFWSKFLPQQGGGDRCLLM